MQYHEIQTEHTGTTKDAKKSHIYLRFTCQMHDNLSQNLSVLFKRFLIALSIVYFSFSKSSSIAFSLAFRQLFDSLSRALQKHFSESFLNQLFSSFFTQGFSKAYQELYKSILVSYF